MGTPRFVRFCRALALLGGPSVVMAAVAIPAFVEGCSAPEKCSGASTCQPNNNLWIDSSIPDASSDGPQFDLGADGDTTAAADAGGGPDRLPDLPFFAA